MRSAFNGSRRALATSSRLVVKYGKQFPQRSGLPLSPSFAPSPSRSFSASRAVLTEPYNALDTFQDRHIGPNSSEAEVMLKALGYQSMDAFVEDAVPQHIRIPPSVVSNDAIPSLTESEMIKRARELANLNKTYRSYIGMGYHNAVVPKVIQRNVGCSSCSPKARFHWFIVPRCLKIRRGIHSTLLISPKLLRVSLRVCSLSIEVL